MVGKHRANMTHLRDSLSSELQNLSKNDLIDLLLLPRDQQKNDYLRKIKIQLSSFNNNEAITDKNLSVLSINSANCSHCANIVPSKRIKLCKNCENATGGDNKDEGMDTFVGVYMAYSIFHGYLNLVIPRTGHQEPHLEELMRDYEGSNDIKFAVYKLLLLIPKSTYCPTTLEELSKRIENCRPLKEKLLTRAGVQKRSYKNSVYKIFNSENDVTYVVAEYATPVKTYKDVFSYNYGEDSDLYKRNKDKVVFKFYTGLQKILQEHEDCTNYCELIFYDDKNENGTFKDVADILMERIEKLTNGVLQNDI